eukprot:gene16610-biopygen754
MWTGGRREKPRERFLGKLNESPPSSCFPRGDLPGPPRTYNYICARGTFPGTRALHEDGGPGPPRTYNYICARGTFPGTRALHEDGGPSKKTCARGVGASRTYIWKPVRPRPKKRPRPRPYVWGWGPIL